MNTQTIISIRTKKLAVLIKDARLAAHRSQEECSLVLGINPELYQAYEAGNVSPTLPDLETLAGFLDVPLEHFLGQNALLPNDNKQVATSMEEARQQRNRFIGQRILKKRIQANISLTSLAESTNLGVSYLEKIEKEGSPIPVPELELITQNLNFPIEELFYKMDQIKEIERVTQFNHLPEDIKDFICQPKNLPFLELAKHMQDFPVDKWHLIAEDLLRITNN